MDSLEFVKVRRPGMLMEIQKTHILWTPQVLHIVRKLYPLEFLLPLNFSLTAINHDTSWHKKCFILGGQRTCYPDRPKDHTLAVFFLYPDTLVLFDI